MNTNCLQMVALTLQFSGNSAISNTCPAEFRLPCLRRQEGEAGRMIRHRKPLARRERRLDHRDGALMPFLASMVVGVADISRAYSAKLKLEQAALSRDREGAAVSRHSEHVQHDFRRGDDCRERPRASPARRSTVDYSGVRRARQATYKTNCAGATPEPLDHGGYRGDVHADVRLEQMAGLER